MAASPSPSPNPFPEIVGLSHAEAAEHARRGLSNVAPSTAVREFAEIVARNLFTWFNAMVAPAAVALLALGDVQAGIAVSGMAVLNTLVSLVQEIRAKRHLDRLASLTQTHASVIREGRVHDIPASDVVQGDAVVLKVGDKVVADGPVLAAQFLEIDESLLTGESDPVRRTVDQKVLSGSFCVAGVGAFRAENVGAHSYAYELSREARRFSSHDSPLTLVINRIVRWLTYGVLVLAAIYVLLAWRQGFPADPVEQRAFVRMIAATITSMIPQGLVLSATIALTIGAVAMSRRGAIVQRLAAVETMANVDVICTDKTGTLTTNELRLSELLDFTVAAPSLDDSTARSLLRAFVHAAVDGTNRNLQALRPALGYSDVQPIVQIPFKSQNRYSAMFVELHGGRRWLVLGALDALAGRLDAWAKGDDRRTELVRNIAEWTETRQKQGLRLLVFCELAESWEPVEAPTSLPDAPLRPLAALALGDELRPDAAQTLTSLYEQGIEFKVISGDNPATVQATVSQLDLPFAKGQAVSGDDLAMANDPLSVALKTGIFGRVAPKQKVQIVRLLQSQGRCVAMIGDGVNDLLPLKTADLGVAMGEGSQATKAVAGLVLENNAFSLLPQVLEEGRLILRNLRRSGKLFLTKNVYSLILILAYLAGFLGLPFPYVPQQVTLLNWTVIGVPAFALAITRDHCRKPVKGSFLREVLGFSLLTGSIIAAGALAVLLIPAAFWGAEETTQRTVLLVFLILCGISTLFRSLRDGEQTGVDQGARWLALASLPIVILAMGIPPAARFFELELLDARNWCVAAISAAAVHATCTLLDRKRPVP